MLERMGEFTFKHSDQQDDLYKVLSAQQIKEAFDSRGEELKTKLNKLITDLESETAASNIGVAPIDGSPDKLQDVIVWLKSQINQISLGQIPDYSITQQKLAFAPATETELSAHKNENASLSQKGHVQLSNSVTSTSESLAATAKAVKTAMDRADSAFTQANNGKAAVANAITDKGVSASPTDTFTVLASKIGQINTGKKFASGTLNATGINNYTNSNSGQLQNNKIPTVSGLGFTPSAVIILIDGQITGNCKVNDDMLLKFSILSGSGNYYIFVDTITFLQDGFSTTLRVYTQYANLVEGKEVSWFAFE